MEMQEIWSLIILALREEAMQNVVGVRGLSGNSGIPMVEM